MRPRERLPSDPPAEHRRSRKAPAGIRRIAHELERLTARLRGEAAPGSPAAGARALDDAERRELHELRALAARLDAVPRSEGHEIPIFLDHAPPAVPRWGHGRAPHPEIRAILEQGRPRYRALLDRVLAESGRLARIPVDAAAAPDAPHWRNGWISAFDAAVLYTIVAGATGRRHVEIGSGMSTRFARRAIADHGRAATITSIDPAPREDVDALCDRVLRRPLEDCDPDVFAELEAGDVLFFDGTHRAFMSSDVTVFFLEILPRLAPGVHVHVHDVFWPDDYVPPWATRHYSEQYLLGAYLLGGGRGVTITAPHHFVATDAELGAVLRPLWERLPGAEAHGCSFWMTTGAPQS